MRKIVAIITILVLVLAACGGDDLSKPTDTGNLDNPPNDEAATFAAEVDDVLTDETPNAPIPSATPIDASSLVVPPPGELVAAETPALEPPVPFDYIYYQQEGGRENTITTIEIYSDGRVTHNAVEGTVDAETIAEIDATINDLNFFGMQGTLLGPPGNEDQYTYRVVVQSGQRARSINAQDGYIPSEFLNLLTLIRRAGNSGIH